MAEEQWTSFLPGEREQRIAQECGLTLEQWKVLERFLNRFGANVEGGYVLIPTGTEERQSNLPYGQGYSVELLDSFGERLIAEAKKAGLIEDVIDQREPDSAGAFGEIMVPGDPKGGVFIDFTEEVTNYLRRLNLERPAKK